MNNIVPIGKIRYYKRHSEFEFRYIDEPIEKISIDKDYKSKSDILPHHTVLDLYLSEIKDKDFESGTAGIIFMRDKQNKDRTYFLPITQNVVDSLVSKNKDLDFIGDSQLFKLEFII